MLFIIHSRRTVRPGYWFAPKRFGIGAVPASPAGWAVISLYALAMGLMMRFMPSHQSRIVVGIALTAVLAVICWMKTDGGWKWRWGGGEDRDSDSGGTRR